jgi:hypothetical protein
MKLTFTDRTHHLAGVMIQFLVSWLQFQNGEDLLITVQAGVEKSPVPNANIRCESHIHKAEYHNGKNLKNYEKFLRQKLIHRLFPYGVLVIDRAPRHKRVDQTEPSNSKRSVMTS